MMRQLILSTSLTLAFTFNLGCSVIIPNVEVCADKGILGAKCAFTRKGEERSMSKMEWDKERVGYFCLDAKSFGKYQKFIGDACAKHQNCIDEITQFVDNLNGDQ